MKLYKPDLNNLSIIKEYLKNSTLRDCAFCPGNVLLWADAYHVRFSIIDDMIVFFSEDGKPNSFTFPISKNMDYNKDIDLLEYQKMAKKVFDKVCTFMKEQGSIPKLHCTTEKVFNLINSWYPGMYVYKPNRDSFDYIYTSEKLATLSGSKLHGKRNHINKFKNTYIDYSFEEVNSDNYNECIQVLDIWLQKHQSMDSELMDEYNYEYQIIKKSLHNMTDLDIKGGLLKVENRPVAFALGERLCADTFDVHFEKADDSVPGAYQMINYEFAGILQNDYKYINREEDLGIEGLRKAKLSYKPDILYNKGIITINTP